MYYRNTSDDTIVTDIGTTRIAVPPGKICEIEKRFAYVVIARKLPLEEVSLEEVAAQKDAVVETSPVPRQRPRAIRGVASGDTVEKTDDLDDLEFKRGGVEQIMTRDVVAATDDDNEVSQVPALTIPAATERAIAARNRKAVS
jgi:tRNA/tmRNA/rRNA uracil-C5-methylase (TrmA/RlmC/RlmD family)